MIYNIRDRSVGRFTTKMRWTIKYTDHVKRWSTSVMVSLHWNSRFARPTAATQKNWYEIDSHACFEFRHGQSAFDQIFIKCWRLSH